MHGINDFFAEGEVFFFDLFVIIIDILLEEGCAYHFIEADCDGDISVGGDSHSARGEGPISFETVEHKLLIFGESFSVIVFAEEADEGI